MADAKQRERAQAAREKMRRNAGKVTTKDRLEELESSISPLRHALFAVCRAQGRIRVSKADLDAVQPSDHIDMKQDPLTGDLMMTFVQGPR